MHSNASDENRRGEWSSVESGDYSGLSICSNEKHHAFDKLRTVGTGARASSGVDRR